jgi:hypothetical protein
MTDTTYEVRVLGVVPADALEDLGDVTVEVEEVGTVLSGFVPDQSALYGLLARLRALGLELVEVRRVPDPGPDDE